MEVYLTKIGNSQGIIIPAPLLREAGFDGPLDLQLNNGQLVLSKVKVPRADWEERILAAGLPTPDPELDDWDNLQNPSDDTEWTW